MNEIVIAQVALSNDEEGENACESEERYRTDYSFSCSFSSLIILFFDDTQEPIQQSPLEVNHGT